MGNRFRFSNKKRNDEVNDDDDDDNVKIDTH